MSLFKNSQRIFRRWGNRRTRIQSRVRPQLEILEDRLAPATDVVTNLNSSGPGSLPYEVAQAEANNAANPSVMDFVTFAPGLTGPITPTGNNNIALDITKNLIIEGPGANAVTISGGGQNQVIRIERGVTANISGLTIADGGSNWSAGGGIENDGTLTLTDVRVTGTFLHPASGSAIGGGIVNYGTLTLTASTVDHNRIGVDDSSTGQGGGIYNNAGGKLNMVNDTVDDNQILGGKIAEGGGVYNFGSPTYGTGSVSMINVTIANNLVAGGTMDGDGIGNTGSLTIFNSIVYNPTPVVGTNPDVSGSIFFDGGNLFGSNVSAQIKTSNGGDQFNANPSLLGPLQDNGGPTWTIALSPNSPALGGGLSMAVSGAPPTDERGFPRPSNIIDIGAYEAENPATTTKLDASSTSLQSGQPVTLTATVMFGAPSTNTTLGTVTFYNNGTALGTVTLTNGSASMNTTLPVGYNAVSATYSGISVGAFVLDPSTNTVIINVSPSQSTSQPPSSSSPSTPSPVGSLSLFALGFGPGSQLDIFEVDQAGQVFAAPVTDLFGGHGGISFVNSSVVLSEVVLKEQIVLGLLLGANNQSFLIEFLSFSDPHVYNAAVNALLSQYSGSPPHATGGSGSSDSGSAGGTSPSSPPSPAAPNFFSGSLTDPFSLVVYLGDEDNDVATLSGNGTIKVTGDGNYRDGVRYSILINLTQDLPLKPANSNSYLNYSGTFTAAGQALPQMTNGNWVPGLFGGGANNLFLQSSGSPDPLTLVARPDWAISVNSSGGGPNGGPSFNFGATLDQSDTGPGQNFGVTANTTIDATPNS